LIFFFIDATFFSRSLTSIEDISSTFSLPAASSVASPVSAPLCWSWESFGSFEDLSFFFFFFALLLSPVVFSFFSSSPSRLSVFFSCATPAGIRKKIIYFQKNHQVPSQRKITNLIYKTQNPGEQ
jgi:hypothetical protein